MRFDFNFPCLLSCWHNYFLTTWVTASKQTALRIWFLFAAVQVSFCYCVPLLNSPMCWHYQSWAQKPFLSHCFLLCLLSGVTWFFLMASWLQLCLKNPTRILIFFFPLGDIDINRNEKLQKLWNNLISTQTGSMWGIFPTVNRILSDWLLGCTACI